MVKQSCDKKLCITCLIVLFFLAYLIQDIEKTTEKRMIALL